MRLRWTRSALADLQRILECVEQDSPHAPQALAAGFKQTAEHLTRHPLIGRRGQIEGTRELMLHRNYLLTYRVSSEAVEILQIWHVAQERYH
jgi:addiction module RelE/StbE family toxin